VIHPANGDGASSSENARSISWLSSCGSAFSLSAASFTRSSYWVVSLGTNSYRPCWRRIWLLSLPHLLQNVLVMVELRLQSSSPGFRPTRRPGSVPSSTRDAGNMNRNSVFSTARPLPVLWSRQVAVGDPL
jgi:hypothetical protein